MKTKLFVMLAACSLFFLFPHGPRSPSPQFSLLGDSFRLAEILELTDLQAQDLVALRHDHKQQVHDLTTQIRELEHQKLDVLNSPTPDPTRLEPL